MNATMSLVTMFFLKRIKEKVSEKFPACALLVICLWICSATHVLAVPLYHLTNLETLYPTDLYSVANDINNSGQIVGFSQSSVQVPEAFLYESGAMQGLGTLGGAFSQAFAINDAGQVVGTSVKNLANGGYVRGFLYSNGTMMDLGTLPGYINSGALAISNGGQIVGYAENPSARRAMCDSPRLSDSGGPVFYAAIAGAFSASNCSGVL